MDGSRRGKKTFFDGREKEIAGSQERSRNRKIRGNHEDEEEEIALVMDSIAYSIK